MDIFTPIYIYTDFGLLKFGSVRDPARVTRAPQAPADVDVLGVPDHSGPKIEALVPFLTSSPGV